MKSSISFMDLLTLLFLYLKLTNQINWSYMLVLSPQILYLSILLYKELKSKKNEK